MFEQLQAKIEEIRAKRQEDKYWHRNQRGIFKERLQSELESLNQPVTAQEIVEWAGIHHVPVDSSSDYDASYKKSSWNKIG